MTQLSDLHHEREKLRQAQIENVAKLCYFALGITASAIAFAFHETNDRLLSNSLSVIAGAIIVWAAGFAAGILFIDASNRLGNIDLNMASEYLVGHSEESVAPLLQQQKRWRRFATVMLYTQLWAILGGAILYGVGHGMHLAEAASTQSKTPAVIACPNVADIRRHGHPGSHHPPDASRLP